MRERAPSFQTFISFKTSVTFYSKTMKSTISKTSAKILLDSNIETFGSHNDGAEAAIETDSDLARFQDFFIELESFKLWGYNIRYNPFFGEWCVSSEETGTAPFKNIDDAIEEADRGTLNENKNSKSI